MLPTALWGNYAKKVALGFIYNEFKKAAKFSVPIPNCRDKS